MRKSFSRQGRFDGGSVLDVVLNLENRDEIVPVLAALQYVFADADLRSSITRLVSGDINRDSRRDIGREGFNDWQVVVLSAVRLGCNLDYDKLHDLCENHRSLRGILGVGDWDDATSFGWRRIRDTLCLLRASTIQEINHLIVKRGQELDGSARESVRADSFVIETNIHYPTDSSLIMDGTRKIIPVCIELAEELGESGWRQSKHQLKQIKKRVRVISQISSSKSPNAKDALRGCYEKLLTRVNDLLERAKALQILATKKGRTPRSLIQAKELLGWIELTEQVCDTANRRVLLGETVPNTEKLFSLFETHTQLYRRGKAGRPNQFGRLLLVFEDSAGFISHYHLMDRNALDKDVAVEQTREVQKLHHGEIINASFDRGFYSPENVEELSKIVKHPCLPPKPPKEYAEQLKNGSVEFHRSRLHHAGIESAIGALQSGNGLGRCRDRGEIGFERYIGLAVLGRNLHVLGKLVIATNNVESEAAKSKRKAG